MPTFDEFKAEGNRAFAAGEFKRAAKIYRDAIYAYGDHPVLFSNKAQCFINLEDWSRAYKDAESGLACRPSEKIRIKLLYRKSLAAQNLALVLEAIECLHELLNIDPSNKGAQEDLARLSNVPKPKRPRAAKSHELFVELVDELPKKFADIVSPPSSNSGEHNKIVHPDLIDSASEELFGHRKRCEENKDKPIETSRHFTELPSMQVLQALKLVPANKKVQSYKYILNLENSVYDSLFKSLGVDHDFFEFFIEACTFLVAEDPNSTRYVVEKLQRISGFNRFSLTLLMCDQTLLDEFFSVVKKASPEDFKHLENIFQSHQKA